MTFARFQAERAAPARPGASRWLAKALRKKAFAPLDVARGEDDRSAGFVEFDRPDATGFEAGLFQGEYALFGWRVDTIKVPAATVKAQLERWAAEVAAEKGRPATKRERAERREAIRQTLRQRAEPVTRVHDVSWNLKAGGVQIWAASRKAVDEVAAAIAEACGVTLRPLTPGAMAARDGVAEGALAPTAALVGLDGSGREVDRGEA